MKEFDIQKVVDEDILSKEEPYLHVSIPGKYSPSGLSGCIRSYYFDEKNPVEFDMTTKRIFEIGNMTHEKIQGAMKKFAKDFIWVENEKAYMVLVPHDSERVVISGRLDTIAYEKDSPYPIVFEYKSASSIKYFIDKPKKSHVEQLNFYLGISLAKYGYLIYAEKNTLKMAQHKIYFDKTMFENFLRKSIKLHEALVLNKPPIVNVSDEKNNGNCAYCKYKDVCSAYEVQLENEIGVFLK